MQRRLEVRGSTTASRVKTLFLYVQRHHGHAAAHAFLRSTKLDREFLEDESRLIPLEVWHRALVNFAAKFGQDKLNTTFNQVIDRENLGVYMRVLRGARSVDTAFQQLGLQGGDDGLTDAWKTHAVGPGFWRGFLTMRGRWEIESDGLCAAARQAELAAIPVLFGLKPAQVRLLENSAEQQVYEVRWSDLGFGQPYAWSLAGFGAGLLAIALGGSGGTIWQTAGTVGGCIVLGLLVGLLFFREQRRRQQNRSQLLRIQTLERAAALRDAREKTSAGLNANTLIAGQYRLGMQLGVGASGSIWEAERLSDGQIVAIKLLKTAVAHDSIAADRLRREAAALGLTWHPNVVEIFDEGHLPDGTSYLVMERLTGESLTARLKRVHRLTPRELSPIVLQVCDALEAVHAAGVVHRDVKPSNIFLASGTNQLDERPSRASLRAPHRLEHVKLLDFGVAQVEWAETRLTNTGTPLGTLGYMSPEQEQGLEIDARCDLFALGKVIEECLTGTPPAWRSKSLPAVPENHDAESGIQRTASSLPPTWRELVRRLTAPLPHHRFPDARAVREFVLDLVRADDTNKASG